MDAEAAAEAAQPQQRRSARQMPRARETWQLPEQAWGGEAVRPRKPAKGGALPASAYARAIAQCSAHERRPSPAATPRVVRRVGLPSRVAPRSICCARDCHFPCAAMLPPLRLLLAAAATASVSAQTVSIGLQLPLSDPVACVSGARLVALPLAQRRASAPRRATAPAPSPRPSGRLAISAHCADGRPVHPDDAVVARHRRAAAAVSGPPRRVPAGRPRAQHCPPPRARRPRIPPVSSCRRACQARPPPAAAALRRGRAPWRMRWARRQVRTLTQQRSCG